LQRGWDLKKEAVTQFLMTASDFLV